MNRLLKAAAALLCAVGLTASASTVTATVTDTDLQTWNNGTFTATLLIPGQPGVVPTVSGVPVPKLKVTGTMSASGVITATLTDTSTVDQKAVWVFEIHSNTSAPSVTVSTPVIGSTPNLTPAFSQLTAPRFATGDTAYGYLDSEVVNPLVGSSYFNTGSTTPGYRQYSLSGWQGGSGSGGSGGAIMPAMETIASDLEALDGTGTNVTDVSGHNNNGTITTTGCNGTPVSWNANNTLNFSGSVGVSACRYGVSTNIPVANVNSLQWCGVLGYGYGQLGIQTIFGSNASTDRLITSNSNIQQAPTVGVSTGSQAAVFDGPLEPVMYGTEGCLLVVYNTTASGQNDQIYWNGKSLTYKSLGGSNFWPNPTHTASGTAPTGNLIIGADAWGNGTAFSTQVRGTLGRATLWNSPLTAQQAVQAYQAYLSYKKSNGIEIPPIVGSWANQVPNLTNVFINANGDSITFGFGVASTNNYVKIATAAAGPLSALGTTVGVNRAVSGEISTDGAIRGVGLNQTIYGAQPYVATFFEGTNNSTECAGTAPGTTLAATIQSYLDWANGVKWKVNTSGVLVPSGVKTLIGTMISRVSVSGKNCDGNWKDVLDPAIRALPSQHPDLIDGIFDFATDVREGADGAAAANSTGTTACSGAPCYQADQIHPTLELQTINAQYYANAILYYTAPWNVGSPHVVTSTTYQMLASDAALNVNTAAPTTVTLPDCNGMTNASFYIGNIGTGAVTVAASLSQVINAPTSIAASTSHVYTDTFNSPATGGCHWQ